jgi:hypothetical protein
VAALAREAAIHRVSKPTEEPSAGPWLVPAIANSV